jgi:hypothetical protein
MKNKTLSEQYNYLQQVMMIPLNKVRVDQIRYRHMCVICISFSSLLPIHFNNDIFVRYIVTLHLVSE